MRPEVKEKWIKALKSGDYQKAKGRLTAGGNQFCCLGVLCDLAAKEGLGRWEVPHDEAIQEPVFIDVKKERADAVLPRAVVEWAGLDTKLEGSSVFAPTIGANPRIQDRYVMDGIHRVAVASLAELNDHSEFTLSEIGDVVEAEL